MKLSPDPALLRWVAIWLALAVASVPLVALRFSVPLAGLLICAALLADAYLCWAEAPLELEREVPQKGARERREQVTLRLRNPLSRPAEVELREAVPRDLVDPEPAWPHIEIAPQSQRELPYEIQPRVRGVRRFGQAIGWVRSPLGLLRRRIATTRVDSIRVQPETARYLRAEALDPKRVLASIGVRPKRKRGDGLDFDGLRDYVPGDEPRRIDWRATARRGRPIVRTHRHEESRTVLIAVDRSRLMGARAPRPERDIERGGFIATKLDHAVDAALALCFASLSAGDRVGLVVFDRELRLHLPPMPHRASLGRFVDALSTVSASSVEADYRRFTREMLARQRKRAMLIVLTDFMEVDREELIQPMALLARRHEVVFAALREPILDALEEGEDAVPRGTRSGPVEARRLARFRRIVLADLLREREGRLVTLRRQGLSVLDVAPNEATAQAVNRYLELRYGAG